MEKGFLIDIKFVSHISFKNEHISTHSAIINSKCHILHNKKIIKESVTKKKGICDYGKTINYFFLDEKKSKEFKTIKEFGKYYNIDLSE